MQKPTRRQFIGTILGAAAVASSGLLSAGRLYADEAASPAIKPPDNFRLPVVTLGMSGLTASLLGVGTGTHGWGGRSAQTSLGMRELVSNLEYAFDRSVTYFDLADQYGSHPFMKNALDSGGGTVRREKAFLLTKTHAKTADGMRADLDRFRKELNTDYLDLVLLHCKTEGDWPRTHAGAMQVLEEAKQKGIIKAHGVSCHSLEALRAAANTPWVDVDLARLNPWGKHMDANVDTVKEVLKGMRVSGKGIIGMKILGQGHASTPQLVEEGLQHAVHCGLLDAFTIGFEKRQELDEMMGLIAREKAVI